MRTFSPRIRLGLILAPLAGCATPPQTLREPPSLKDVYAPHFLIGAAVDSETIASRGDLLRRHFSSITATNAMKAYALSRGEGRYDFADADNHVRFAEANGIAMRGHTLVWHWNRGGANAAPDWFFEGDRAAIRRRLETYIADVVTHFRGRIYAWDVVNEPTGDADGEIYRKSRWFEALGPDYIEIALRAARAADPDAKLFLNDYDTERPRKLARFLAIVDDLRAKDVPLDGLGHQLHMQYVNDLRGVRAALAATAERGLVNHVTELDISLYADPDSCYQGAQADCEPDFADAPPSARLAAQAQLYGALFDEFRRHPSLKSVTTWGLTDADSWLNGFPVRRTNRPLLFDAQGAPKPAFWAVAD